METRQLVQEDYDAVEALFRQIFSIPVGDLMISWRERDHDHSVGLFVGKILIGFCIASYHKSSKENLYIDYVGLAEECRGSGVGTQFLVRLVEECYAAKGSLHLYPERDSLISWYERHGFRKTHNGYYVFHSYPTRGQREVHARLGLGLGL